MTQRRFNRRKRSCYERYELLRSPLAQKPTQRDLAKLLGISRDDLRRLANYKNQFIVRRQITVRKKQRNLAYPEDRLRVVHEKLKFHLNKIKQPDYLFSPRKKRSQRDNAQHHLDQQQYLALDLKQFYPSTTKAHVRTWLIEQMGMYPDVAGLFSELATVDGIVSFGSPLTPVLCTLVHRKMFDEIDQLCEERGLRRSLWVDDLTISGQFIPGELVTAIRSIIRNYGLKSHKIIYREGNRTVFITGIGVVGKHLVAPRTLHDRIQTHWNELFEAETVNEKVDVSQKLLAQLGTLRHIVGRKSKTGQRVSNQINAIKQKRDKLLRAEDSQFRMKGSGFTETPLASAELPW